MEDCFTLKDKIKELIQAGHYEEQPQRALGYREREGEATRRRVEPKKR